MNDADWRKEAARLKGAITCSKSRLHKAETLAEKIEKKAKVKEAEEALRLHRLNYYELVQEV